MQEHCVYAQTYILHPTEPTFNKEEAKHYSKCNSEVRFHIVANHPLFGTKLLHFTITQEE